MKKIITILILALLIPAVSAQDEKHLAGITPDSLFYGLDVFFDNVRARFTPSSLGRAKVRLRIMQERMAEMEEMADKNKTREAERAELEGQKQMEKFESSITRIRFRDVAELNESVQTHAAKLEIFKQRLMNNDTDYDDTIDGILTLLETSENVIANIPEDSVTFESLIAECIESGGPPEECALAETRCKEMGATTAEECRQLSLIAFKSVKITSGPPGTRPPDPHGCKGAWYSDGKTKWCCTDSDGTYHTPDTKYTKGTVDYKVINLKTGEVEEGIETDFCDGDMLTEWKCGRGNWREHNALLFEEHECQLGCEDGACVREVIKGELPEGMIWISDLPDEERERVEEAIARRNASISIRTS